MASPLKLYLNNADPTYTTTTKGTWSGGETGVIAKKMSTSMDGAGSPAATAGIVGNGTSGNKYLVARLVSEPITENMYFQTTSNLDYMIGCYEDNADMNTQLGSHIWVTVGDSSTVRGTLLANQVDSAESALAANVSGESGTYAFAGNVIAYVGDRIVWEAGPYVATTNTSYKWYAYYGGNGTDLANNGDATTKIGFLSLPFAAPPSFVPSIMRTRFIPSLGG